MGFSTSLTRFKRTTAHRIALSFLIIHLAFTDALASTGNCAEKIRDQIPLAIEATSAQVKERDRYEAQRFLRHHQAEIENEVYSRCSNPDSCSESELMRAVVGATKTVLDRHKTHKGSWAGSILLWGTLAVWVGANVWVSTLAESKTAVVVSSLLTVIGTIFITKAGGARLDVSFENLRRKGFAADRSVNDAERGYESQRHLEIYKRSQGLRSTTEMEGRDTDRVGIHQVSLASLACQPQVGETYHGFLKRSAGLLAIALSDILTKYPDLELSEPEYADWVTGLFSDWHLNDSNREVFRKSVLELIRLRYDKKPDPGGLRMRKYERAIRAWTLAPPDITLPLDSHQSQTALPLRKAEDPSPG